jgi:hypothetical protein
LSNQNAAFIEHDVLIGYFSSRILNDIHNWSSFLNLTSNTKYLFNCEFLFIMTVICLDIAMPKVRKYDKVKMTSSVSGYIAQRNDTVRNNPQVSGVSLTEAVTQQIKIKQIKRSHYLQLIPAYHQYGVGTRPAL